MYPSLRRESIKNTDSGSETGVKSVPPTGLPHSAENHPQDHEEYYSSSWKKMAIQTSAALPVICCVSCAGTVRAGQRYNDG